jgi:outer membrane protein assembly factor BamB
MKGHYLLILGICTIFFSCTQNVGWEKWRGPNANGISTEVGFDYSLIDSSSILWKKEIGAGHSAIALRDNYCFVSGCDTTAIGNDSLNTSSIFCIDTNNGKTVWEFKYEVPVRPYPGPRSTPVLDGNRLFALSSEGILYCLSVDKGKELWQTNLSADSLTIPDQWGYCPSPVVYKNLVLLNLNKKGIAIDKRDGKVVWTSEPGRSRYASVQLFTYRGADAAVFMADSQLYLLEPQSGKERNRYVKKSTKGMENDVLFYGDDKIFTSNEMIQLHGDSLFSLWENDSIASFFRTGIILGNCAYQFSDHKNKAFFYCVDLENGTPLWREDFGAYGAVSAVDDKLLIITGDGNLIVAQASDKELLKLKSLKVLSNNEKEGIWCWTPPVYFDGKIFVRNSGGEMICIKAKT